MERMRLELAVMSEQARAALITDQTQVSTILDAYIQR
jgi:hypothetical protein